MHKLTHKPKELGCLPAEALPVPACWQGRRQTGSAQAGRRIVFSLVVLAYLGFLGLINALMFLPALGWLPDNALSAMGHFGKFLSTGDTHDLIHELVFALVVGTAAVGLLSQLWKPKENFAGQLVALIAWVVMIMTAAFTNNWVPQPLFITFGGLTLLATILHPAGLGLFNWFGGARANRILLSLVVIAAIPLLALAFTNINLQIADGEGTGFFGHNPPAFHGGNSVTDQEPSQNQPLDDADGMATDDEADHDQKHIALGHYRNMAALSFIIILIGILASFRPSGCLPADYGGPARRYGGPARRYGGPARRSFSAGGAACGVGRWLSSNCTRNCLTGVAKCRIKPRRVLGHCGYGLGPSFYCCG